MWQSWRPSPHIEEGSQGTGCNLILVHVQAVMKRPNHTASGNRAMTRLFHAVRRGRAVPEAASLVTSSTVMKAWAHSLARYITPSANSRFGRFLWGELWGLVLFG
jgi:hypothetical protein